MSLGAGILLGCLFLGCVYLYLNTREIWNWKKILLIAAISIVLLVIAFLLLIFWDKLFNHQSRTSSGKSYSGFIQSYDGIAIGDNISDIEFKLGKLKSEGKTQSGGSDIFKPSKDSHKVIYTEPSGKTVEFIGIDCEKYNYDSFNGVKCGTSSEEILKKHKDRLKIWCPISLDKDADPYRVYDLIEFGTRFYLQKNHVVGIRILKPDVMKNPKHLKECGS
jgi:hypothetical protein